MMKVQWQVGSLVSVLGAAMIVACAKDQTILDPRVAPGAANFDATPEPFEFTALASSAVCTNGGDLNNLVQLPAGFTQTTIASEPSYADVPDMNTLNENGPQAGRYMYRTHEGGSNGSVSITDLKTGQTRTLVQRTDWESLDGITWTPWGTLLFAEETNAAGRRDPNVPQAVGGLVYEIIFVNNDPTTVERVVARPAIGSKSHEGMRFDAQGNLYSISERTPGYIFKFVPDNAGDLSAGQTYVMKIHTPDGGVGTGQGSWIALDRTQVQIDASAAGDAVGATGFGRPEDLEYRAGTLYAAITSEHRVIALDLAADEIRVYDYVRRGLNTTNDFSAPDNLAFDSKGNLYITEDPGGNTNSGKGGDDIWFAEGPNGEEHGGPAAGVRRFATLTDCEAEPTGVYVDTRGLRSTLYVNIQHRGGDRQDKTLAITRTK
jgi:uncharacterized protein